ncbi:hypothetical protein HQ393_11215 [Chitinibacter bivalviorum]|uniref:Uncharacterized protein n=1 Tax=Chitinibacter bivalviorum TaxID=2739434 RepID=A0A7H9BJB8_9NEIS|nr:hypothetical protein [Chitinibacter bivalviorum]QLG88757.1 hypothetical protein HQ393_11215 [Chitinibacter bivalviorum]
MQPNRRLSDFLPLKFANGQEIKQFSKPCVACGKMLHAKHMHGVARLIENHIAIAAKAHCESCGADFSVACVINSDKQVKRVVLPRILFNLYLRNLPLQNQETAPSAYVREQPLPEELDAREDAAEYRRAGPVKPSFQPRDIVRAEESLGRFQEKPIPAWLILDGARFEFDRIAPDARTKDGEYLLDGCLIYRPA